jgi:UDP-N-acetylmuramoyl-L-alanyl-D-glutamate--2,6-diaminopimelate ligase
MNTPALHSVPLSTVLQGIYPLHPHTDRQLLAITQDSRHVQTGSLFMACKGARVDARLHIDQAVAAGAAAILVEADEVDWCCEHEKAGVPVLPILHLREQMATLAARFYGEPGKQLRLIGVTGTNGKTTTSQLLARAIHALGHRCGVIGTLGSGVVRNGLGDAELQHSTSGPGTTPDAVQLQQLFAELQQQQADTVVMEVSSHALVQQRVIVDDFNVAIFTNLTRDHLDYHGTMTAYGAAKRSLFAGRGLQLAVLNLDDEFTVSTSAILASDVRCFTWSVSNPRADVYASAIEYKAGGLNMAVQTPWGAFVLSTPLLGSFNVSNLLAVLTTVLALDSLNANFNPDRIANVVAALPTVVGRMQIVGNFPVTAVVDYAHTPDGLAKALQAVREHCRGDIWCVFGCGGDRDRGKRRQMAAIAEQDADHVVLTDDNPRFEASTQIIADMQAGLQHPERTSVIADRAKALAFALTQAKAGDVVLIAGKGHEDYQEVAGKRLPFSDQQHVLQLLAARFANNANAGVNA